MPPPVLAEPVWRCDIDAWCGFVVAMRGRLVLTEQAPRREWLIVTRWGRAGEYLTVSRTSTPAGRRPPAAAPIGLSPEQTALAIRLPLPDWAGTHGFLFTSHPPPRIAIAGAFLRLEGHARLRASGTGLRLRAEGRCVDAEPGIAWRLDAVRAPWPGEFIDGDRTRRGEAD